MPEFRLVMILLAMGYIFQWGYGMPPALPWPVHVLGIGAGTGALGAILIAMVFPPMITNGDWNAPEED